MKKILILLLFPCVLYAQRLPKQVGYIDADSIIFSDNTTQVTAFTTDTTAQQISDSLARFMDSTEVLQRISDSIAALTPFARDSIYSFNNDSLVVTERYKADSIQVSYLRNDSILFTGTYNDFYNFGKLMLGEDSVFLELRNKFPDFIHQLGGELVVHVINKSGATIPNGAVVRYMGATGDKPNIILSSNSNKDSSEVAGVATFEILNNQEGLITVYGQYTFNTNSYSLGDTLWLGIAGGVTDVMPPLPAEAVHIGKVTKVGTSGRVTLDIKKLWENLEDYGVVYKSANNGFMTDASDFYYDGIDSLWVTKGGANSFIVNNNLGVGENSPITRLHISESSSSTTVPVGLTITNTNATTNVLAGINLGGDETDNTNNATISAKITDHTATSEDIDLIFETMEAGTKTTALTLRKDTVIAPWLKADSAYLSHIKNSIDFENTIFRKSKADTFLIAGVDSIYRDITTGNEVHTADTVQVNVLKIGGATSILSNNTDTLKNSNHFKTNGNVYADNFYANGVLLDTSLTEIISTNTVGFKKYNHIFSSYKFILRGSDTPTESYIDNNNEFWFYNNIPEFYYEGSKYMQFFNNRVFVSGLAATGSLINIYDRVNIPNNSLTAGSLIITDKMTVNTTATTISDTLYVNADNTGANEFEVTADTTFINNTLKTDSAVYTGNPHFQASYSDSAITVDLTQNVFVIINGGMNVIRNSGGFVFQGDSAQIPKTGWYKLKMNLSFNSQNAATTQYNAHFFVNNSELTGKGSFERGTSSTAAGFASIETAHYLTKGDWVKGMVKNETNNNDITTRTVDFFIDWDE